MGARKLGLRRVALAQWASREADSRIDTASRRVQHYEAVAPARSTITGSGCASGGRFQVGRRVGAGGDGLLQLGNRRRGLLGGCGQVEGGVRKVGAPLSIPAQVQRAAIGQFEADGAGHAGVNLVAREQAITFNEEATRPFRRNNENLTNNAFDDGNNTAH